MIARADIVERVFEWQLTEEIIEKDYVLGWLLWGIATDPVLSDQWVFKGGTCLKKCYIETYRFSEDLDFTVLPGGPIRPEEVTPLLQRTLARVNQASGIDFSAREPLVRLRPGDLTAEGASTTSDRAGPRESWVDDVVSDPANRVVLLLARLMVHRGDSLAWAGLTVLEPNVGPTFRKAIYDRAVESGKTFAEALLAAHADNFDGMTGAAPGRAKDLIDRTLAWLDGRPVPEREDVPERWGDCLLLAFSGADARTPVSDALADLLGIVDDAVEADVELSRFLGHIQPLAKDHASAQASGVRFLTIGMSKGLTVEATIIIGGEEGIIPDPRGNEDEERRLLYVGLTRAKRFTYVTWATRRTGPTARAGSPRVQSRRFVSRLLRGGPVETQNGQTYIRNRWS
jgi:hypothetical protein